MYQLVSVSYSLISGCSIFVPSGKNPLVDILLSRTVSGESPSKAKKAKRPRVDAPLARSRQAVKPRLESSNVVAG